MRKAGEGCCGLTVVGLIVVVIVIVVGAACGGSGSEIEGTASTPGSPVRPTPSPRAAAEALTPESSQAASPASAAWSELRRNANPALSKLIVDVLLETKVSEPTLRTTSRQIRSDNRSYERIDIGYYIKGRGTEGLNWALARFVGSTLDVSIHGFTLEEEQRLMAQSPPDAEEVIGRWIVDGGGGSVATILIDSQGVPFLHEISARGLRAGDLSGVRSELSESPMATGRRFDWVDVFPSNYMVVESEPTGRLLFHGSSGVSRIGYPFPVTPPHSATATPMASPAATVGAASTPRPTVTYAACDYVPTHLLRVDTQGRVAVQRDLVPSQPDGDNDGFACGDQLEHKRNLIDLARVAETPTAAPRPTPKPQIFQSCQEVPESLIVVDTQGRRAVPRHLVPSAPDGDNDGFACGGQLDAPARTLTVDLSSTPKPRAAATPIRRPTNPIR